MATTKDVDRTPSGRIKYRGESFAGFNKPKRTPGKSKKFAVLAKYGIVGGVGITALQNSDI